MRELLSFLTGLIFGAGLLLGGMTDPLQVKGFLDMAGDWNPALVFVMGGAVTVGLLTYPFARRQTRAWSGDPMDIPQNRVIDRWLVLGGILFGTGWGLAGLCPGPALVNLGTGNRSASLFVLAMIAGMLLHDLTRLGRAPRARVRGNPSR